VALLLITDRQINTPATLRRAKEPNQSAVAKARATTNRSEQTDDRTGSESTYTAERIDQGEAAYQDGDGRMA
jgi:hypothetical protein